MLPFVIRASIAAYQAGRVSRIALAGASKALGRAVSDALAGEAEKFTRGVEGMSVGFFADKTPGEVIARAYFHEFGTVNVPERSFLRSTMTRNKKRYAQMVTQLARRVAEKKMTAADALNWLGTEVASDVQSTIQRNIRPRLQRATVDSKKRKGYARPNIALYATGEMFDALAYKLVRSVGRA